jgi:hypothetical protein
VTRPEGPDEHVAKRETEVNAVLDAIDWDRTPFPSNRRTFQQIRSYLINHSETYDPHDVGAALDDLGGAEHAVLILGIKRGLGYGQECSPQDREAVLRDLADHLEEMGIAGGRHEAGQLAEQLENWAAGEARRLAPGRPR